MKVEWLPDARRQRKEQISFIGLRNPRAAFAMNQAIIASCRFLADHPLAGRRGRIVGTHEYPIPGTPYLLVYRVEPKVVVILRFLHTSQNYP